MKFLVTGAAGFIGFHASQRLLEAGHEVVGIDNMNDYYDVALKEFRLNELAKYPTFTFVKGNIADKELITELFEKYKPSVVVNLAAQAGVRYSITNPDAYVESNLVGFFNILEACRHCESLEHLVYASSSSVYGSNKKVPYSTDDKVDNPVSLYAATKKSNELMAHAYSKLYNIPSTGLRFFTVYGPAGRPDAADPGRQSCLGEHGHSAPVSGTRARGRHGQDGLGPWRSGARGPAFGKADHALGLLGRYLPLHGRAAG